MKQTSIYMISLSFSIIFFTASCNNQLDKSTAAEPEIESSVTTSMTQDSLTNFGKRYAEAWSSKNPNDLADFFTSDGILLDGNGKYAKGKDSIALISKMFHDEIPDIIVSLDSMVNGSKGIEFHWSLLGTNTNGIKVNMKGVEVMEFRNSLICKSQGSYTDEQYEKVVKEASKNKN